MTGHYGEKDYILITSQAQVLLWRQETWVGKKGFTIIVLKDE